MKHLTNLTPSWGLHFFPGTQKRPEEASMPFPPPRKQKQRGGIQRLDRRWHLGEVCKAGKIDLAERGQPWWNNLREQHD